MDGQEPRVPTPAPPDTKKEQKPKVELIKNPKQAEVVDAKPGEGEQSTRRKVVVKRKASSNRN